MMCRFAHTDNDNDNDNDNRSQDGPAIPWIPDKVQSRVRLQSSHLHRKCQASSSRTQMKTNEIKFRHSKSFIGRFVKSIPIVQFIILHSYPIPLFFILYHLLSIGKRRCPKISADGNHAKFVI
jgi:hypothetical protein